MFEFITALFLVGAVAFFSRVIGRRSDVLYYVLKTDSRRPPA